MTGLYGDYMEHLQSVIQWKFERSLETVNPFQKSVLISLQGSKCAAMHLAGVLTIFKNLVYENRALRIWMNQ